MNLYLVQISLLRISNILTTTSFLLWFTMYCIIIHIRWTLLLDIIFTYFMIFLSGEKWI